MKVIFIEVDGVLQNHRTQYIQKTGKREVDEVAVSLINNVVRETGAKLVFAIKQRDIETNLKSIIEEYGFNLTDVHDDQLAPYYSIPSRERAIDQWIRTHTNVTHAISISTVPAYHELCKVVVASAFNGFTYGNYLECIGILSDDPNAPPELYKR